MAENRTIIGSGLVLLLAITFWVFHGSLLNPFHFDDALFLQSPQVTEPGDPWYLLKPNQTRQLTYLTFYWNYRSGGSAPSGYHWVNLILHLGNVAAFYCFARLLIRRWPQSVEPMMAGWLPLAAAGVFALHPVQSEPVNYIYQRSTLLAAFFALWSMNSYLWASIGERRRVWLFISGTCYGLAVVAKEAALVLPLLLMALIWAEAPDYREFWQSLKRARWLAVVLLLAAAVSLWILSTLQLRGERTTGFALMSGSLRYLWAQIQVFAAYLRLLLTAAGLSIDHDFRPAPFTSFYGWACVSLLACILAFAVIVRRRNPLIAFLIMAFLILLFPTTSFVPSRDLIFEHRLYLPMVAAGLIIAWVFFFAVGLLIRNHRHKAIAATACMFLLMGSYAVGSRRRTYTWGTEIRLWEDAVAKAPGKPRAQYNLGVAYLDRDREKARQAFLRTLELDPHYAAALYNLGWLAQVEGSPATARKYYEKAVQVDPEMWQAHQNLGNLNLVERNFEEAVREFRTTIRIRKDYWPAYLSLATLLIQTGETRDAIDTLENLKLFRWDLLEARYLSAYALAREKRFAEAENELRFITERDSAGAYRDRLQDLRSQFPPKPKFDR